MNDKSLLGPWVRRFLLEYAVKERNLARNTQRSYRDTLSLLIPFIGNKASHQIDRLKVFLLDLEETRGCSITTRNQRLAAIHALARFIGLHSPEHIEWCGEVRAIAFKKTTKPLVTYLEKNEMDALLAAPDRSTAQGRRDYAVILFLYNTGARADEAAQLRITDLDLSQTPERYQSSVDIHGKGNKLRRCPLWPQTVSELVPFVEGRSPSDQVFLNRCGRSLTRFGIHTMIERYVERVSKQVPSLRTKRVSPHTIRHTTATHLLRAGVDINTIRAWLGHVSLNTTNIYAEVDLEMKAKALAACEVAATRPAKRWREDAGLMAFLQTL
jgi:site-specific recombinase XerD